MSKLTEILNQFYENAFNETAEAGILDESLLIAKADINAYIEEVVEQRFKEVHMYYLSMKPASDKSKRAGL